jgi:hypothetical protein
MIERDWVGRSDAGDNCGARQPVVAMNVTEAIQNADAVLPGKQAIEGEKDPRWQAVIAVGDFVESDPEPVWLFIERWGKHPDEDLRAAIACCLLEHLLEYHFDLVFPRMERLARSNPCFAEMVGWCGSFGQSELPQNAARRSKLVEELENARRKHG